MTFHEYRHHLEISLEQNFEILLAIPCTGAK